MTRQTKGITKAEFDHLVDGGFTESLRPARNRTPWTEPLPDKLLTDLAIEGAAPGLSKSAARFHGALRRCLGVPPSPPTEKQIEFLKKFDAEMKTACRARGIQLRDD